MPYLSLMASSATLAFCWRDQSPDAVHFSDTGKNIWLERHWFKAARLVAASRNLMLEPGKCQARCIVCMWISHFNFHNWGLPYESVGLWANQAERTDVSVMLPGWEWGPCENNPSYQEHQQHFLINIFPSISDSRWVCCKLDHCLMPCQFSRTNKKALLGETEDLSTVLSILFPTRCLRKTRKLETIVFPAVCSLQLEFRTHWIWRKCIADRCLWVLYNPL